MTDIQIFILGIHKMGWLLWVIPAAIIWTGFVEAVNRKWERRLDSGNWYKDV